jgi:hypothetical protein
MNCGCCACLTEAGTTSAIANRPGLSQLHARAATYDTMFDAMLRRLTAPALAFAEGKYSLHGLRTRETDDPAIAFLDAWATVGDVLTFYQERIIHEGYLRTAIERRSVLELARLVGYTLKPGVAASAHVAYTVEDGATTIIPAGSQVQSIPGADEQPQMFETSEPIEARSAWNVLLPLQSRRQTFTSESVPARVWIAGANTRLDVGDVLLFVFRNKQYQLRRVKTMVADHEHDRVELTLEPLSLPPAVPPNVNPLLEEQPSEMTRGSRKKSARAKKAAEPQPELASEPTVATTVTTTTATMNPAFTTINKTNLQILGAPPVIAPIGSYAINRSLGNTLSANSDTGALLAGAFRPGLAPFLYDAIRNTPFPQDTELLSVHVFRRHANLFGYNGPLAVDIDDGEVTTSDWPVSDNNEVDDEAWLDITSEKIFTHGYAALFPVVHTQPVLVREIVSSDTRPRTDYGISARATRVRFDASWWSGNTKVIDNVRGTAVLIESEQLTLAEQPIFLDFGRPPEDEEDQTVRLALDVLLDGLKPGRWIIVTGERTDIASRNVRYAELAMIAAIEQSTDGVFERPHTILVLAAPGLNYRYRRATVKIYVNVVKATHGETRSEILGGGNAAVPLQTFALHQKPLTYLAAPTPAGAASTLAVRVNEVLWYETDTLSGAGPTDRVFLTKTADDGKVSVIFGTGREGARLPSGSDNVRAVYRSGIGKAGNVRATQLATAVSRPLGVRDVINPLPATGGADPESRDDARRNVPMATQSLGRVVSVRDYADFARTFAGIAKASAVLLSDGRTRLVHLTIGGTGDIDITPQSDLFLNLVAALRKYGDPYQPFRIESRQKLVVAGNASVRVDRDYLWSAVQPRVQAALLDAFSYDRRAFGQPLFPSEVVAAIQRVEGVESVDLLALGSISEEQVFVSDDGDSPQAAGPWHGLPAITTVAPIVPKLAQADPIRPAQIAYLPPDLAELFILTEDPR